MIHAKKKENLTHAHVLPYPIKHLKMKPRRMKEFMTLFHKGSHWRPQAMCDIVLRTLGCFSSPYKMLYGLPNLGNQRSIS
jgi:hypothetical protein